VTVSIFFVGAIILVGLSKLNMDLIEMIGIYM
jgi:hypothetical protein